MCKCSHCGEEDPTKFYGHKKSICGACHNKYTTELGQHKKKYARDKLGGKCAACGFNQYEESLDIHHLDPAIKDKNYGSMRGWSLARIDKEIENCVLLCKNCHCAFHSGHDVTW
ncbi:HNH endonuclease [Escherichia coli]|uniref:HNH endonuclease n=1 Tax=Escherichia coli TaxID=562 RepID=UPI00391D03F9